MRHKIALARCCRSTDIYWTLAVVQEEIQNIFGTGLLCRCHRWFRGNVLYRKQLHRNTSQKDAF